MPCQLSAQSELFNAWLAATKIVYGLEGRRRIFKLCVQKPRCFFVRFGGVIMITTDHKTPSTKTTKQQVWHWSSWAFKQHQRCQQEEIRMTEFKSHHVPLKYLVHTVSKSHISGSTKQSKDGSKEALCVVSWWIQCVLLVFINNQERWMAKGHTKQQVNRPEPKSR